MGVVHYFCAVLVSLAVTVSFAREKVIFDSDGLFDDALALGIMLNAPDRIELLGLTLGPGSSTPKVGVHNILTILELLKREDIPVFLGEAWPFRNSCAQIEKFSVEYGGVDWKGACRPEGEFTPLHKSSIKTQKAHASRFIAEAVQKHPGEVSIVAVGALTNIAKALREHPEIASKIKRILIMGGNSVYNGISNTCPSSSSDRVKTGECGAIIGNASALAEFNFWYDPESAAAVLNSKIPIKLIFNLDITNQAQLDINRIKDIEGLNSKLSNFYKVRLFNGMKKHPAKKWNVWDLVPATFLIDSSIITDQEEMYAGIVDKYGPAYGALYAHPLNWGEPGKKSSKIVIMKQLDFSKFYSTVRKKLQ